MWALLLLVVIAIAALLLVSRASQPKAEFVVEIDAGRATVTTGKLSLARLSDCEKLCAKCGIQKGQIWGVLDEEERMRLRFSPEIPEENHQQFRNVWSLRH